jgi:hypothetical protein
MVLDGAGWCYKVQVLRVQHPGTVEHLHHSAPFSTF